MNFSAWRNPFGCLGCVLLLALASSTLAAQESNPNATVSEVTIDVHSTLVKSFFGFGIQWDPYAYPPGPEAWRLTLHRLDYAQPAFFRVMTDGNSYCDGFDAAGKPRYVWDQGEKAIRQRLGSLLDILDYAQKKDINVVLGEWSPPRHLQGAGSDDRLQPDDPRWAKLATDFVTWLRKDRGYSVIHYFNLMNEPNGSWMWPGGKVDYDAWAAGIRGLRQQFDGHGLREISIVGPDNAGSWDWIDRVSHEMPAMIGDWEMHWYARDQEVLDGSIEKLLRLKREVVLANDPGAGGKSFFLAESGLLDGKCNGDQQPRVRTFPYGVMMADYAAQVVQAGWMGLCAWDLDDAMHTASGHPKVPVDTTLKLWGFWNTQGPAMGHPEDEQIRPWFYPWSLMSRLFPKGCRIVETSSTGLANLRIMAGQTDDGRELNVMIVNNSDQTRTVHLTIPEAGSGTVRVYHYFEKERPTDEDGFPVPQSKLPAVDFSVGTPLVLAGRGCVFLSMELVR